MWFRYLEDLLGLTSQKRQFDKKWQVSDMATGEAGSEAKLLGTQRRVQSEIHLQHIEIRKLCGEAASLGVSYFSVSDGTGGGTVSGFAVRVVYYEFGSEGRLGVGWARGRVRSDKAELAGLVQQLRWAPDREGVWLASDCNAMLTLIEKARRADG